MQSAVYIKRERDRDRERQTMCVLLSVATRRLGRPSKHAPLGLEGGPRDSALPKLPKK